MYNEATALVWERQRHFPASYIQPMMLQLGTPSQSSRDTHLLLFWLVTGFRPFVASEIETNLLSWFAATYFIDWVVGETLFFYNFQWLWALLLCSSDTYVIYTFLSEDRALRQYRKWMEWTEILTVQIIFICHFMRCFGPELLH